MSEELDLGLPPANPGRTLYRPKVALVAQRWQPDDLMAAGAVVGWLMGHKTEFDHPDGQGGTTLLRIWTSYGTVLTARPGDWIVKGLKDFMVYDPEAFAANYEPISGESSHA